MKYIFRVLLILLVSCNTGMSTNFVVTNTADAGAGSLRQAINDANAYPGNHTITFNIPVTDAGFNSSMGVWIITPASTLPLIMRSNLLIDGTSQTANQGDTNPYGPEIMLDGNHAFGSDFAFHLYNVSGVIIQGFIIGKFTVGIEISGSNSQNNIIRGNYIGCNYNAMDTLSNTHGIEIMSGPHGNIIGGSTPSERNIVSGNNHVGIRVINSNGNIIKGNYVGLNRNGNAALRNYDGISIEGTSKYNIIGGYTAGERNYIAGNTAYGIVVFGLGCSYNKVIGNYSGTDITGNYAIPNTYGVLFDGAASYNSIGGRRPGAGNLLSGNSAYGVFLYNPGTQKDTVIGNLIGTNAAGTAPLPNANGIVIDGPSYKHFIDSNVISGNSQNGISIHIGGSDSNIITRNFIGTDFSATYAIGNSLDGIRIGEGPKYNIIGGPGKGNIIAYNGGNGVSVMTAADLYNTISENSIYDNAGLGIDLFPEGITLNDAGDSDTGPNELLNFPVIDSAKSIGGNATIYGHIDVPQPLTTRIEIFIADVDATGYGEGKTFLGSTFPDISGFWQITVSGVTSSDYFTATATDINGNTSEFSYCFPEPPISINELSLAYPVTVFPNPFSGRLVIKINDRENKTKYIRIYNVLGETVLTCVTRNHTIELDGNSWVPGIYFCSITTGEKTIGSVKIIKR